MLQCRHQPPEVREQAGAPGKAGSWPLLGESGSAVWSGDNGGSGGHSGSATPNPQSLKQRQSCCFPFPHLAQLALAGSSSL